MEAAIRLAEDIADAHQTIVVMVCAHGTLRHGTLSHWTLEIDRRTQREVVWSARGVDGTEALASSVMGRRRGC